jgi:HK97 family phage prohead protease
MDIERKVVSFNLTEVYEKEKEGSKYGYIKGYASTYGNVDRGDDMVMKGAFTESLERYREDGRHIKLLYQHDSKEIIGIIPLKQVKDTEKGLWVEAEINLDVQRGRETYSLCKQMAIWAFSIGYSVDEYGYDGDVRQLKKVTLWEISTVGEPMNEKAKIVYVKAVSGVTTLPLAPQDHPWSANAAIMRVRKFTDSIEKPSEKYKKAFMYYDAETPDDFTSYKLPYADVIDGKLHAVPRAIFAIAAVLNGARGGVSIPDSDKEKIKRIINDYYDKMDLDSPLEKTFRTYEQNLSIDDVEHIKTKRDFELFLRDLGMFSKSARVYLASHFKDGGQSESVAPNEEERKLADQLQDIRKKLQILNR